jgi:hypothetical protein
MPHRIRCLAASALMLTCACVGSALAFSFDALVGQWFTELEEKQTYQGEPYTIRKQIEDNRADGTKTATFRFYDNCRYIGELVNVLDWGVDTTKSGAVYWTKCKSITQGGDTFTCSSTSYYDLTEVTANTLRYTSRDTGTAYTMQRVDAAFKIPPSGCVSAAPRPTPAALR